MQDCIFACKISMKSCLNYDCERICNTIKMTLTQLKSNFYLVKFEKVNPIQIVNNLIASRLLTHNHLVIILCLPSPSFARLSAWELRSLSINTKLCCGLVYALSMLSWRLFLSLLMLETKIFESVKIVMWDRFSLLDYRCFNKKERAFFFSLIRG